MSVVRCLCYQFGLVYPFQLALKVRVVQILRMRYLPEQQYLLDLLLMGFLFFPQPFEIDVFLLGTAIIKFEIFTIFYHTI